MARTISNTKHEKAEGNRPLGTILISGTAGTQEAAFILQKSAQPTIIDADKKVEMGTAIITDTICGLSKAPG